MTQAPGKTTTRTRPTRVRWKIFLLLLAVVTINYVDRGSISVALPMIKKEFGLSEEVTGVLLAAFFWTYALMQLPSGWLIDRFGPRRVVGSSCIAWGAATALTATAPGPGALIGMRALMGATEAPVMPAGGKLNALWMPLRERGRGAVILDAGAPLGAGIGGIAIAGLIAWTGGWRPAFVIAGAVTVLMGVAAWWYIRDNPRQHPSVNDAEATAIETSHEEEDAAAGNSGRRPLRNYLKFRSFWAMCLAWLGFNGVFYGLLTWGPLYLSETKGFDIKTIGWSTLVIFGAGFVGELIGGSLADWWRARGRSANTVMRALLGVAGVIVVAGLVGVTLVPDPIAAVVLLSTVLFFLRWVGLMWSVPSLLGGRENAGTLGAAMNLSGNIAGILTPMLVGFIVGATGNYTFALLYFIGAGLIMTASVLALDYTKRLPA
ncbi:MFS transporter [Saccharopolyspora sp. WRP15-2]|uniref:MFS transporter n=1 Tax=Saccharopolyspora oryzae TaxID=2997343 RepID=A0ABT4UTQ9_9PSEU|nr:MFS transporter [Saccharopolyspora oryzae]MDA3625106.1 MFS transporter [Saccharopolyspora oryzae]